MRRVLLFLFAFVFIAALPCFAAPSENAKKLLLSSIECLTIF